MAKSNRPAPVNGPSKTGNKSGGGRGNNPKKKATTPIGKVSRKVLIHTNGQTILGGWLKTGIKVGVPLSKRIMTMTNINCLR